MATQVQFRRGTSAQHAAFTGALAEMTFDTDLKTLRAHDGSTAGGVILATRTWVSDQIIAGVADGSLTPAKFANTTQNTFLGRILAGSGAPTWLSAADVRSGLGTTLIGGAVLVAASTIAALQAIGVPGNILYQANRFR